MDKVWLFASVPAELAEMVEALASEAGVSREDFVLQVLRVDVERRSRDAGQRSRRPSAASRSRRPRAKPPIWRCPRDWAVLDLLVSKARDRLSGDPLVERDILRGELTAAVATLRAVDPPGVVDRALNEVLGPPEAENRRTAPENLPPS